jgi:HTH-type transcriptional regulator, transcriptional repressor of NAD biosynthesis genes
VRHVTTRGFLLGKFMPPHNGHVFLCDFASRYADALTILVCSLPDDPIPGALRFDWMRELAPSCRVLHLDEAGVPQQPDDDPRFWEVWRGLVRRFHPEPVDFVFASESYGRRLAAEVGARFVPVDPVRLAVPVSATQVRRDPFAVWDHLPPPVRAHYARTVCFFGPESTGKSMLAHRLAERLATRMVPEYGRIHTGQFGTDCTAEDLRRIVRGHTAATRAARRQANRILVLDTDPVLTAVWSDMLLGTRPADLDQVEEPANLYLLTDIDVPWIDDGTRYFPDAQTRRRFLERCREELIRRELPFVTLSGDWDARLETAVAAIRRRFPGAGAGS